MASYRVTSRASRSGWRRRLEYVSTGQVATKCTHLCPSPPKQEEVEKDHRGAQDPKVHRVPTVCPPSHHPLPWHGGPAAALPSWPQDTRGRRAPQTGSGRSCWQGASPRHQHQRNAPQCSHAVLETSQHASCKSSATRRSEPRPLWQQPRGQPARAAGVYGSGGSRWILSCYKNGSFYSPFPGLGLVPAAQPGLGSHGGEG